MGPTVLFLYEIFTIHETWAKCRVGHNYPCYKTTLEERSLMAPQIYYQNCGNGSDEKAGPHVTA